MASGTISLSKSATTSAGSYIEGKITWSSTPNTDGNYSSVTATLYCRKYNDGMTLTTATTGTWAYSLSINGNAISGSVQKSILTDWVAIASHSISKLSHNANGSKTITIKGSVTAPTGTSFAGKVTSGSKDVALDSIPRESTATATPANIGSQSTITINRASSSFTHTLTYEFGDLSGTIAPETSKTSISWTIPESFYAQIPNAKTGTGTIYCITYSGAVRIGVTSCNFTVTASESACKPSVSVTAVDTNAGIIALTGSDKRIVKGFSDVEVTTTATPKNSASISSVSVACGSTSKNGTSVTFSDAESATIKATAKDSRGYSNSATASGLTLINYISPTIVAEVSRESPTSDKVSISVRGNWFNGTFGSVTNTLKVEVRYKPKSQSEYADSDLYKEITVTKSGNTYTGSIIFSGLVYTNAYNFRIRVRDAVHTNEATIAEPVYRHLELSKGVPVFDWGENDFRFNVPLYSGGVNFTQIYQAESAGLAQGESATLENPTDRHRLYYVRPTISDGINPANVYIPCTRVGNMITGIGGYPHATGRIDIFCVYITFASNGTFTVNYCGYWNTKDQEYAQRKVNGIFAVL